MRQLYEARLPHEYEELWSTAPEGERRRAALTLGWVNVYRARDYVGRSVFADPDDDATLVQGAVRAVATPAGGPELLDACLRGPGSHTGYWGDPSTRAGSTTWCGAPSASPRAAIRRVTRDALRGPPAGPRVPSVG